MFASDLLQLSLEVFNTPLRQQFLAKDVRNLRKQSPIAGKCLAHDVKPAGKAGAAHAGVGKASFDAAKPDENIRAFVGAVSKAKPAGVKAPYMKQISLSATMGPGVSVAVATANAG